MVKTWHPSLKIVSVKGSHHLHMEDPAADEVASQIRAFLGLD